VSERVLHVDFIALANPDTSARRAITEAAAGLAEVDGVVSVFVLEAQPAADYDLAVLFLLQDLQALEPFGTHARYVRFLQGAVAPALRAFAGADAVVDADFEPRAGPAACLALIAPDETYDFEVRQRLQDWGAESLGLASQPQAARLCAGLAAGERQRYRGLVLACSESLLPAPPIAGDGFVSTLVAGRVRQIA
jgi:hypothetical protein